MVNHLSHREFLKSFIEFYLPELTKASHGSTMQHITRKELEKFSALFPNDKPEQEKIADVITALDRAIEQTEALIAKQRRIKTGLMQDLLTKGIDEHGNIRSEATHAFKDSPLGRIPVDWQMKTIDGSLIELIDGDRGENYPNQEDLLTDGYCLFLSAKNVTGTGLRFSGCQFISEERDRKLVSGKVQTSDIILTTRGTVGNFGLVNESVQYKNIRINSDMIIIRSHEPGLEKEFLFESLRNHVFPLEYRRVISGSAQPQLPARDIKQFHILIPQPEEQRNITKACKLLNTKVLSEESGLHKLCSAKAGLMHDLLTGKRRVTDLLKNQAV